MPTSMTERTGTSMAYSTMATPRSSFRKRCSNFFRYLMLQHQCYLRRADALRARVGAVVAHLRRTVERNRLGNDLCAVAGAGNRRRAAVGEAAVRRIGDTPDLQVRVTCHGIAR